MEFRWELGRARHEDGNPGRRYSILVPLRNSTILPASRRRLVPCNYVSHV